MAQGVADTEMIRRQNRRLVLAALRRHGPLSRSRIAELTGLSNASLTAIGAELVGAGLLVDVPDSTEGIKARGRPALRMAHNRDAGYAILFEIDVNRCRISLVDYAGILVDRVESALDPRQFSQTPPNRYFIERIGLMIARNAGLASAIESVSISVQGILDPSGGELKWSPIPFLAGHDITGPIDRELGLEAKLFKRGRLMADGMRWLDPDLDMGTTATLYLGSTIGMGLTFPPGHRTESDLGTEFGHMIHMPNGALCRCGARGCIEAYAADYAVLRAAYSVPEHGAPALAVPAFDYNQIITRARQGDRNAMQAFTRAGQAIGYGLNRVISIIDVDRIVLLGPTTTAYDLLKAGIEEGATASLMGQISGLPPVALVADAGEPIYRGLLMRALTGLDRAFAKGVSDLASKRPAQ